MVLRLGWDGSKRLDLKEFDLEDEKRTKIEHDDLCYEDDKAREEKMSLDNSIFQDISGYSKGLRCLSDLSHVLFVLVKQISSQVYHLEETKQYIDLNPHF